MSGHTGLHSTSLSRGSSTAPTSHGSSVTVFHPSPSSEAFRVPKRSSQAPHPVSWTYSIHNLQATHPSQFTRPSQYQSRPLDNDVNQSGSYLLDDGRFPREAYENGHPTCDIEPDIDEVSPDEDDRIARRAFRGINIHFKLSHTDTFTDPTPGHEPDDCSLHLESTHQPSDRDIGT